MSVLTIIKLYPISEVLEITTLSKDLLYKKIKDGSFPKNFKVAEKRTAWRAIDIQKWIDELAAPEEEKTNWLSYDYQKKEKKD